MSKLDSAQIVDDPENVDSFLTKIASSIERERSDYKIYRYSKVTNCFGSKSTPTYLTLPSTK